MRERRKAAERWLSAPEQANMRSFRRVARRRRLQRAKSEAQGFLWKKVKESPYQTLSYELVCS